MKNIKTMLCNLDIKTAAALTMAKNKLREQRGDSNLVAALMLIVIVILIISVIFWPWVSKFFQTGMAQVDKKASDIWNLS